MKLDYIKDRHIKVFAGRHEDPRPNGTNGSQSVDHCWFENGKEGRRQKNWITLR